MINSKVHVILDAGLKCILCIGEVKEEYDLGLNKEVRISFTYPQDLVICASCYFYLFVIESQFAFLCLLLNFLSFSFCLICAYPHVRRSARCSWRKG